MFRGIDVALLRFCLQVDDGPAAGTPSNIDTQRDPKDLEWLREALNAVEDPAVRLKKCIQILHEAPAPAHKVAALDELLFYVEDLDIANDFAKMGLGELAEAIRYQADALPVLEDTDSVVAAGINNSNDDDDDESKHRWQVRMGACWVVSTMAQNNPFCQTQLVQQGLFQTLMWLLLRETQPAVIAKALGAVSAIVRDCDAAQQLLLQEMDEVLAILSRTLAHSDTAVRTKSVVLLLRLVEIYGAPVVAALDSRPRMLAAVLACIRSEPQHDATLSEQALQLVARLVQRNSTSTPTIRAELAQRSATWTAQIQSGHAESDAYSGEQELIADI